MSAACDHDHDDAHDVRLARRVAASPDVDAEAALCARLWPRIRAYGRLHLRHEHDALDLAQHVVVVLLEALRAGRVADLERFPAYVSGTCRNAARDWQKGERRRGALLERFGPAFATVVEPAVPAGRRLEECLARLAERERTVLVLTFYVELDSEEIASDQAMSAGSVRVTRHRALEKLRTCMGGAP